MQHDLETLAQHHLNLAQQADHGRSSHLFLHDGPLRQSVIALTAGNALGEHETPLAASVQLLRGLILISGRDTEWELGAGQLIQLPHLRHTVQAVQDAVLLFTAVTATAP